MLIAVPKAFLLVSALLLASLQEDGDLQARRLIEAFSSNDPAARNAALSDLKKLGETARAALLAAQKSPDQEVSTRVRFLLARLDAAAKVPKGLERIGPSLLDRVAEEGAAAWAKVFIHLSGQDSLTPAEFDQLVPLAFQNPSVEDFEPLCVAVEKKGCRKAIHYLVKGLESEIQEVRDAATHALTDLRAIEAEEPLKTLLKHPQPHARSAARTALHDLFGSDADPLFIPLLRDPDPDTVLGVVYGLSEQPSPTIPPSELHLLLGHAADAARRHTTYVLNKWKVTAAAPWILPLLHDLDSDVRKAAAETLGNLEYKDAIPALRESLSDEDPEVRGAALLALSQLEDRTSIPRFMAVLKADTEASVVRAAALEALAHLKVKEAAESGLALLGDADKEVRRMAARLVAESMGPSSAKRLAPLLQDRDGDTRVFVASLFEAWKSPEVVPAVLPSLADGDPEVRQNSLGLLGKLGGDAAA